MLTFELPQTLISAEPCVLENKKGSSKVSIGSSKVTIFGFFFFSFGTINSRKNSLVAQRSPPTLLLEKSRSEGPERGDFGEENRLGKGGVDRVKKKKGRAKTGGF